MTTTLTGPTLRARRDALGLFQKELAAKLGVRRDTLSRWERGTFPIGNPVLVEAALAALEQKRGTQHERR